MKMEELKNRFNLIAFLGRYGNFITGDCIFREDCNYLSGREIVHKGKQCRVIIEDRNGKGYGIYIGDYK